MDEHLIQRVYGPHKRRLFFFRQPDDHHPEKYGEEENLLKKVLIYDLTTGKGNQKVITAERGKIVSEEGSKYMTFILYNGNYYEEHIKSGSSLIKRKRMPSSNATFKEYEMNIDISSLSQEDLDDEKYKGRHNMLSIQQINDTLPDLKNNYDEYVGLRTKSLNSILKVKKLYAYQDSLKTKKIASNILENFNLNNKSFLVNSFLFDNHSQVLNFQYHYNS